MTRTPFVPRPTPHDLKAWRGLVEKALKTARRPDADPMPLTRAGDRAFKARPPVGFQGRDSVFLRLVLAARGWFRLTAAQRTAAAGELQTTAQACREILEGPSEADRGRSSLPPGDR